MDLIERSVGVATVFKIKRYIKAYMLLCCVGKENSVFVILQQVISYAKVYYVDITKQRVET